MNVAGSNMEATAPAIVLTELQLDALSETFNLALGEAASVFADMIRQEISLSIPQVEILQMDQLVMRLRGSSSARMCGIHQSFESAGGFKTDTHLVFQEAGSLALVRHLLGQHYLTHLSELEHDALAEIGNVIIHACMGSLANRLGTAMVGTLPQVSFAEPARLFRSPADLDQILVARIDMTAQGSDVSGFVLLIMDLASTRSFVGQVAALFGNAA
jgi:chemotaxis protein CheC